MNALSTRTRWGARKPGNIYHPVKTGGPVDIHERAFEKYIVVIRGKKGNHWALLLIAR